MRGPSRRALAAVALAMLPGMRGAAVGDEPLVRTIRFAGHAWRVKASPDSRVGPGPNYFSDSTRNVEVDASGRLHLRIVPDEGRWSCAEVISEESFGHGRYRFQLDELPEPMDPRAVLGLFTWSDDPAHHHRELDIEIATWGDRESDNAQFVVQPYTRAANVLRFRIPPGLTSSVHAFLWAPERVVFESSAAGNVIGTHAFDRGIPPAGDERVRINLWLLAGRPPADGQAVHVVVKGFDFSPP